MMSTEEENEDDDGRYFLIKSPKWRSKKYKKLINHADNIFTNKASGRSKEQKLRRIKGSLSKRVPPKKLSYGYDIFIET